MFEEEAEEYIKGHSFFDEEYGLTSLDVSCKTIFKDGAEYGYKKALEEWKKCFLACSSPFCNKQFPTVESSGVLGNMEKKEND